MRSTGTMSGSWPPTSSPRSTASRPGSKKFRSLIAEGRIGRNRVLLLKPQTFMNDSGDAVQQALRFYKLDMDALTVFHDELDLAPFKVKVRVGGGLAGHNGLRSIDASLGPDFRRVRIGIGHPGPGRKDLVTPHVLGNYAKSEMEPLSDMLAAIAAEAEWLADGDDARFMSEVALQDAAVGLTIRPPLRPDLCLLQHALEPRIAAQRIEIAIRLGQARQRLATLARAGSSS